MEKDWNVRFKRGENTIAISSARWLILVGIVLTAAGVLSSAQLERHSFANTQDFEFRFLEDTFLPVLMFGLVTMLIGSVLWAWRATSRNVALYGFGIVILTPLVLELIPINIHGWTSAFMFVGVTAILIGGLFLILAAVRALSRYRNGADVSSE